MPLPPAPHPASIDLCGAHRVPGQESGQTGRQGRDGPGSLLQPPSLSSSWPSSGCRDTECSRGLDTMTLRGHYVIHLVLAVSPSFLPRQTERSRSHLFDKACGLDKYLPSGSLCQECGQGTFSPQLPAGLPRFPRTRGLCCECWLQ